MVSSMLIPGPAPTNTAQKVCDFVRASKAHVRFVLALAALLVLLAANAASVDPLASAEATVVEDSVSPDIGGPAGRQRSARAAPAASAVSLACRASSTSRSASEGEHADAHPLAPLMLAT